MNRIGNTVYILMSYTGTGYTRQWVNDGEAMLIAVLICALRPPSLRMVLSLLHSLDPILGHHIVFFFFFPYVRHGSRKRLHSHTLPALSNAPLFHIIYHGALLSISVAFSFQARLHIIWSFLLLFLSLCVSIMGFYVATSRWCSTTCCCEAMPYNGTLHFVNIVTDYEYSSTRAFHTQSGADAMCCDMQFVGASFFVLLSCPMQRH